MLALLGVSLGSTLVVGTISLQRGRAILRTSIFNQLTSIRTSKAHQFELFFENLRNQTHVFANDKMFIAAMREFKQSYRDLEAGIVSPVPETVPTSIQPQGVEQEVPKIQTVPETWVQEIDAYYTNEFVPRLEKNVAGNPVLNTYRPTSFASRYLQYHYIASNPKPVGEKNQQVDAGDGSQYSQVHRKYHQNFDEIVQKFGYYDLFLIDPETGNIVYSVYKETDYATSLFNGPYQRSNLAKVVEEVLDNPEQGTVRIVDFDAYRPSYAAPAAFLAAPIYDGANLVGILAIQLPVEQINRVMTSGEDWQGKGLGKTGETYLVGDDQRMRSVSRFLLETPDEFKEQLRSQGTSAETLQLMENFGTTILVQAVETVAAQQALKGKTGTRVVTDYRGIPVLSSYAPLNIQGLDWVILAEMDIAEAFEPLQALQKSIFILTVLLILVVTGIANFAANIFVNPIKRLSAGANKVSEGHLDTEVNLNSADEFGELAQTFNAMVQNLREQQATIARQKKENEALLLNILPSTVATRRQKGEMQIADQIPQVTLLVASIEGFTKLTEQQQDVALAATWLNELVTSFDEAAKQYDVKKLTALGEQYIAVCGLTKQRLDQTKRIVDFAIAINHLLHSFNAKHSTQLSLRIGIHLGPIQAAIVGKQPFMYTLWGETLNRARQLHQQVQVDQIVVTQAVYEAVQELYTFEAEGTGAQDSTTSQLTDIWLLKRD
ncbi:MAG: HAMP domain-containing protein [Spirulina sp. SIO3F2]|nr:HAMP domain-containing protein [Spirulina sp. SIO3F2]